MRSGFPPASSRARSQTSTRFSSSAALTLKKWAADPAARTSSATASACGSVTLRSRCTPMMPMPRRPSSRAVAAPKPLEAPSTSPHAPAKGRQALSSGILGDDNESPSPALSRPRVVCPAALRYGRPVGGKGDRPAVENRWWVDQGKDAKGNPLPRPPAAFGGRFFRTGEGFEQERARVRLTDSNLKWLEEASPPPDGWGVGHVLARERLPEGRLEEAKAALRLPPGRRGVLIDSGTPLRAILTAQPGGDRLGGGRPPGGGAVVARGR